jgi:transposase
VPCVPQEQAHQHCPDVRADAGPIVDHRGSRHRRSSLRSVTYTCTTERAISWVVTNLRSADNRTVASRLSHEINETTLIFLPDYASWYSQQIRHLLRDILYCSPIT